MPALTLSLALHLLLFWPAALPGPAQLAGMPLSATLRGPAAVAAPAVVGAPAGPQATERRPRAATQSNIPLVVAGGEQPVAVSPALTFAAGGSERAVVAAAPAQVAGAANEGIDADGVRVYRIDLARGARAHKRYPPLARERGWAGIAEVRVDVSGEGAPRRVALTRSSGHDLLDSVAVDMLAHAAADTSVPESLRGRAFAVSLPVVFDLGDALSGGR